MRLDSKTECEKALNRIVQFKRFYENAFRATINFRN